LNSLFDFIFSNPIFVIIIIGVLAKLFKSASPPTKNTDNKENKRPSVRTVLQETFNEDAIEKAKQAVEDTIKSVTNDPKQTVKDTVTNVEQQRQRYINTFEETHQEQLERFKKQYQPAQRDEGIEEHFTQFNHSANDLLVNTNSHQLNGGEINLKLTQKKLIESVIMAEVLGPPRAMNRYKNVAQRRKRI